MNTLRDGIERWISVARDGMGDLELQHTLEHVGRVVRVGDGVATVSGLPGTRLDELLLLEDGALALAMRVDEHAVGCVLIRGGAKVAAGTRVRGTGNIMRVPVGNDLLGRIVDSSGSPLDDGPPIAAERYDPIEQPAPAIVDRDLVTEPLMTGLTAIDAMIPLGRGQRELIIGDRKTGKTAVAVDTMINQRNSDVVCVYAAIGQKTSVVHQVVDAIRRFGAVERCIFVVGEADAPPGAQWITPYAACTMAEYYRDQGRHALLVIDDLTKHAIIYRQLSLLLRNPPGREAYPGDVFYIHARLLERAAKLAKTRGGGSLTALPIAETQEGNLTAYIPTNLISITDGQIYLEPKLFHEGQKPAINVGMSVSRVGGKTQAPAMKGLAETLKLDYAQFLELELFTRFGSMSDARTRRTVLHGRRIRAILSQPQFQPRSLSIHVALLLSIHDQLLDELSSEAVDAFLARIGDGLSQRCRKAAARIDATGELSAEDRQDLSDALEELLKGTAGERG